VIRLLFGGDVMLSRHVGRMARARKDPAYPFRRIAPFLAAADIAFVNLESPFCGRGGRIEQGMVFKAEPEMIQGLTLAGVDVVSTANNHARDRGARGVEFTLEWLERHGIEAVGTGASRAAAENGVVLERRGVRFGFLAYTYDQANGNHQDTDERVLVMDTAAMRRHVARLKARSDAVIVSMHAGAEYSETPGSRQVEFARAALEAGASVVAGHHPHVAQPVEAYAGGVIFYSLGNLVFDQMHRPDTQRGLIGEAVFRGAKLESWRTHPVRIRGVVPELADAETT